MAARRAALKTQAQRSEDDILNDALSRGRSMGSGSDEIATESREPETGAGSVPKRKAQRVAAQKPRLVSSEEPERVARSGGKTAMVAYHPGPEDRAFTVWMGVRFEANIPREIANGELIKLARTNPFFSVDGKRAPKHARPPKPDEDMSYEGRSGLPDGKDPEKHEVEMTEDAILED